MKTHIGTKIVNGTPMTRLEYNNFRGWQLPADAPLQGLWRALERVGRR